MKLNAIINCSYTNSFQMFTGFGPDGVLVKVNPLKLVRFKQAKFSVNRLTYDYF